MPTLAKNKKAYFDYEILEIFEAGIQLSGAEVKSIKGGQANLKGSFVSIKNNEAFIEKMHIAKYKHSADDAADVFRQRKLLLKSKEIIYLDNQLNTKGLTIIPLELYTKGTLIKTKIGICRGKKQYDKRAELKRKSQEKEIRQALKRFT